MAGYSKVPVSKIADYASDPVGYCERKGGVRSISAAQYGIRGHIKAGGSLSKFRILVVFVLLGLALYGYLS